MLTESNRDINRANILDKEKISWINWGYKLYANITWDNTGFFKHSC